MNHMPKHTRKPPENLRQFIFHGIDLLWQTEEEEVPAENGCPWCGHDVFTVNRKTTLWGCFSCGERGNDATFLSQLWKRSKEETRDYRDLSEERRLLYPNTLKSWQVVRSYITNRWMIPGYNAKGKLTQLYKWTEIKGERYSLLPTPTLGHQLHGVNLYDESKPVVYLCEGPWDAMVLWETLSRTKETNTGLRETANPAASLLAEANVLAVPGCQVFLRPWLPLFAGKTVNLLYDSDHPRKDFRTGKDKPPAGFTAMRKRVFPLLMEMKKPPTEINYVRWGSRGYDPSLPSGYDVRDCLT